MTKEESIRHIEAAKLMLLGNDNQPISDLYYAFDMAKEALKLSEKYQKAFEDIRAEIEEQILDSLSDGGDDWFTAEKVNECLEIIDKHNPDKAESEG